ncbi:protein LATERAL BRANCHING OXIDOREDUCTASE 1-like [Rutidosis leptorrhynchoides]|uniref:protein LATERAL BRANCHING OXIDOREDUCTASE 1-like n=1 Tax=Rutidosis leptorrhynchoides TaxID=125765 RepID=UPI003A98FF3A
MPMKQVLKIAANCNSLPERYIRKHHEEYGHVDTTDATSSPTTAADIPVIDFSLLISSSSELEKLKSAITTWGSFQAINHGIESSFLDKVREMNKLFFSLPTEEKNKWSREENDSEGYGNDTVLSDQQVLDWTDRLYLTVFPQHLKRLQFWPHNPTQFREVIEEYSFKVASVNEFVLKALARSLNLDENCFLDQYGTSGKIQARFCYYPPCQWPEKVLGLKPHADGSAVTVLLQDKEVEGLEFLKDGQWFGFPIIPDALTINIGDQIEVMSNGIFKSPVHRVSVNSKRERMTVGMFCIPQTEKDIGPVEGLITDETPRLYKNVTFSLDFFFEYVQKGRRLIEACKI